ncbi:MAG: bifunctional 2-methylcitrate dehydratase/aconitate hydratase [Streptosporangiales bacterium]|nr:bifunctional 2-methylcitrate dehydratase/aconitate hydratase [Streptosporangiales bacterium]
MVDMRVGGGMGSAAADPNELPEPDLLLTQIAEYAVADRAFSDRAVDTALLSFLDAVGCAARGATRPDCLAHLGPVVPGTVVPVPGGARVPFTGDVLDPVRAAHDTGLLVRWIDANDAWLSLEGSHPSDNLGPILAAADALARGAFGAAARPSVGDVLTAMIKAHEIQGILSVNNGFREWAAIDHTVLVRVASAAVTTAMLDGDVDAVVSAVSHAWMDGGNLRAYRHAPLTGPRKSWAAGHAGSRGLELALLALRGEPAAPSVLSVPRWGFNDALFRGHRLTLAQPLGNYVMERVLFKTAPVEFHGATALECCQVLHPAVRDRLDDIATIVITTQRPTIQIISKTGPLHNYADRDHCLQYIVAVALMQGRLDADMYSDEFATDPRIDALRERMHVEEDPRYTEDYVDPEVMAIATAIQVTFTDGTSTDRVEIRFPVGHPSRRDAGRVQLREKLEDNLAARLSVARTREILRTFADGPAPLDLPVDAFVDLLCE